ncbi:MAG: hypothetical protein PHQ19_00495 [Candidatus Krumholzibacteria bacterium]|nr:hypothetical protein [Candidatus Krumholzibacteria bacterium]
MKGIFGSETLPGVVAALLLAGTVAVSAAPRPGWMKGSMAKLEADLTARFGVEQRERLARGMSQVADFWRDGDGGAEAFEEFVAENFAGDQKALDAMFERYEFVLEQVQGHMAEISRAMGRQADLDIGPLYQFDRVMASYSPSAHLGDDLFDNRLAFVVLLNFPLTTLDQRLAEGASWTRRQWAEARLADRFSKRIPASVNLEMARAGAASDQYIADYNIWMHHLVSDTGVRLFPEGMRLLSHWNLRDQIKADYAGGENALERQRLIALVMERIVDQSIPEIVVNNPHVDWDPRNNTVSPAVVNDSGSEPPAGLKITGEREPDTRYRILLGTFLASRLVDEYSPTAPTLIARRFDGSRELPEERVQAMLETVCSSPLYARAARLAESRLGRALEPFDIWYNGFVAKGEYSEPELDALTRKRYPDAAAFERDIPRMLRVLGFPGERADYIASKIVVEPARGSGHAAGAGMCSAPARLRTRVGSGGMDYKGFNIATHELGHNVEQVLSLCDVDFFFLEGVPNTAFTEAFAYVFQENDLMLLGLDPKPDPKAEAMKTINEFWMTVEIGAVSLVDMKIWHWMYDHPDATPAELREATVEIAREVWNRYFASIFGARDVSLLAIYSHIVHSFLYLPDYAIGHMIAFQVK